jgi:4-amino-4-deoxy-L-arabinose transferase-like glycosyltransferase
LREESPDDRSLVTTPSRIQPPVTPSVGPSAGGVTRVRRFVEPLALGLLVILALQLRLSNLGAYTGSFDEGIRSQQLFLMSAGYRPFRDIFSSQGPLLLDLLYPFFWAFGQTLEAARMGVVFFSVVGIAGAWWIARHVAGPVAGVAAVLVLGISPVYLEDSRLALAEVPTIAPTLLAIGALLIYGRGGSRGWLVVSAGLCAVSLLIKPMAAHVGVPLAALIVMSGAADRSTWLRRTILDLAIYGIVVAAVSALVVIALGPAQVWDNLGAYRSGAGHALGSDWATNLRLTRNVMANERVGFFALAMAGTVLGLRLRPTVGLPLALWVVAILAMFLLYGDLADKHIVYLVPPLALLAAVGVGLTADVWRRLLTLLGPRFFVILSAAKDPGIRARGPGSFAALRMTRGGPGRVTALDTGAALVGLAAVALYVWTLLPLYRADRYLIWEAEEVAERRRDRAAELDMAEVMRSQANPDEWVLSDNPNAAFQARRKVIPSLVDTSGTRVDAGSLTSPIAIDAVTRYRPAVVVTWARRLGRLDDFTRWLTESGYRLDRTYDNGWKLYVRSG